MIERELSYFRSGRFPMVCALMVIGILMLPLASSFGGILASNQTTSFDETGHDQHHGSDDGLFEISCGHCSVVITSKLSAISTNTLIVSYITSRVLNHPFQLWDSLFKPPKV